jgi:plastocyanin
MARRTFLVLVALFALAACAQDVNGPGDDPGDQQDTEVGVDEDTDVDGDEATPIEPLDDCAEVSAAEGAPVGITMMDTFFEPPCLAVSSTQAITLANAGNLEHNFTVADGDIDIDVDPGEEATTDEIGTDLAAGTYEFFCEFHEEAGMIGTLVVE